MSNEIILKLEEGLYEDFLEEIQNKNYGGINKFRKYLESLEKPKEIAINVG